jgi:hypothetical protein
MKKRRIAEVSDNTCADADAPIVDRANASRFVMQVVDAWRDPCGVEFDPSVKVTQDHRFITVSLGDIPEIHGSYLKDALGVCGGGMNVNGVIVRFADRCIDVRVGRTPSDASFTPTGVDSRSHKLGRLQDLSVDSMTEGDWTAKLMQRVDPEDKLNTMKLLQRIATWDENVFSRDFRARIKASPTCYTVCVSGLDELDVALLPEEHPTLVDLQRHMVVITSRRLTPLV